MSHVRNQKAGRKIIIRKLYSYSVKIPSALCKATVLAGLMLLSVQGAWGQSAGDYQTRQAGNWDAQTTWQRYNGTVWQNNQGYPGQNSGSGTVTIRNGHNVTLNISPAYPIEALSIPGGNTSTSLNIGNYSLDVTDATTITSTSNNDYKSINVVDGAFSTGSVSLIGGGSTRDAFLQISGSGSIDVMHDVDMNSSDGSRNYILFTGNGTLNIGGTLTGGNITSTPGGSQTVGPTSGTVNYNSNGNQSVGTYNYYNLTISGSGNKTSASSAFSVANNLTVNSGNLVLQATDSDYTVGNNLIVDAGGVLTHSVSWDGSGRLLSVAGNLSISGIYDYSAVPRAHLQMTGTGARTINTGSSELSILTLMNGNFSANGTVTVNDNFWAMFGTAGSFSTNGQTVNAKAGLLINGGSVNINGGILNITGGMSVGTGGLAGVVNMTSGTLNTDNLLIYPSCSFTCTGSPQINLTGNFTNNGTFSGGSSNISFTGAANQNIDGFTTLGNVSMTKTGGTATLLGNVSGSGLTVNGAGGTISMGDGLTHTFSGTFSLSNGSVNGGTSTLRLGGAASITGGSFTSGTGTVEFFGGAQNVPGFTYNNLTISGGNTKTIADHIRVNGDLNLANGILALGSYDLTLGQDAGVSGSFSASNMISIANRSVIKEGNDNTDFIINLPIGIGTAYTPVNISSFSATIAPAATITVRSAASPATGVTGAHPLNRHWITSTSGISGTILADISFAYLPADIPSGGTAGLYEIIYKPQSGIWRKPGGAGAPGDNPLRATACTTLDATWTGTEPQRTIFYSYSSGSWDDASTWTLDPSGAQWINPNSYTPETSPTSDFDEVVVLSGYTVTVTSNDKANQSLTVTGTLDFGSTTGHSFSNIAGTGRIRLAGDNFPSGNASDFTSQGQGEGTVEYYGNTRNLAAPRTFYNMEVNMSAGNTLTLLADYVINGNLDISNGVLSINNTLASNALNITVYGNVTVEEQGRVATGTANARHQLNLYGDFTNNGQVRFTNRLAPDYSNEANDGVVDVNFLNDSRNQNIICGGITNFYRIEIDKGDDFSYVLNIDATDPANFSLLGFADETHGAISQLTENNNALGLMRGTVRIGNSISIPVLSLANVYSISENAQLWIDRGTVLKNGNGTLAIYGKLKITNGLLEARTPGGITFRNNGILSVEGGTVNTNQIRSSDVGSSNYGGYVQTSGAVNVIGGTVNSDYFVFSLPYPASVFNMSGGVLTVNTAAGAGGILINSDAENIKVTGGTVIAETNSTHNFLINSTAAFWNLSLKNSTVVSRQFTLGSASDIGPDNIDISAQPLKVLNDFRIWGTESGGASYPAITFSPGTNDIYIGGSFFIENGAQYIPVSGGTPPYDAIATQPTSRNTTYFIKTSGTGPVEELYQGNTSNPLEFGHLVVDRTNGYEVKLTSGASRVNESVALDINGSASVLSGTLNQNLFTIRTWGAITNNDRMGTWNPGITPSRAQIQLVENPALTLSTTPNAVFGNVQVNVTPPSVLTLTSDVYIERMEYVKGLIYLKAFNLKIDNMWNMETGIFQNVPTTSYLKVLNNGYSGSSMIYTDGKGSDGGLTLKINANSQDENENNILNNFGPVTFPVGFTPNSGTTLYFRPAQMVVKNLSSPGYITIRPVLGALPTTNQAGGEVLQHYWRVTHSGFTTLPTVAFRFYYRRQTGIPNVDLSTTTNETNYVPGKVLDESPYTRLYENSNDIFRSLIEANSRAITINGSSTGALFSPASAGISLENANYTAGVTNRFTGSVYIYYTRDNEQQAPWNNNATWTRSDILNPSYSPHDSRQPAASSVPGSGDVAVIGWIPWTDTNRSAALRGQPHGVFLNDTRSVAEVVFTKMTDASGNPVPRRYRSNFQFRPTLCINAMDGSNGILSAKLVKGEGLFWNRNSDPDYTIMDIGDFAREDSSYVIYENFTNNRIVTRTPALFPNLYISNDGWGSNDHYFTFANNINTTGNVELLGDVNLLLPTGATGDFTVGRDLIMFENNAIAGQQSGGGARIDFGNTGTARRFIIKGSLLLKNSGSIIQVLNPNATAPLVDHELHIQGSIVQGTTSYNSTGIDLWSGNNNDRITLYLDGSNSMTYNLVNGTIPDLYRLVINKGNSVVSTAQFNCDFNLNGPSSGSIKSLELQNGLFIVNNAGVTLNLTTGNDHFLIPSTAGLEMRLGTAFANTNSGIALDGLLRISGGNVNMSGGDNPIEYSASGNATVNITGGTLTVGGQVRRSPTSDVGILNYSQSGGVVIVGNNSATVNNRGVFEILNPGSSFNMTGGDLYIVRSQTNPAISAFYFDPSNYSIGATANIHIGHSVTPAGQNIGIFAGKSLPRLRVNNTSGNNPSAMLEVVPAVITSLLQIDAGASFNANGLDLTLQGDMTASGTFVPNGNTTFFSGSGTQTINGGGLTVNFNNLDKTGSGNLILNAGNTPLLITNILSLRSGTFTDYGNTITVRGNVLNDAIHINNGTGNGIVMNGSASQTLSGNGTFGKLTINNQYGVNIPVGNQFTITRALRMQAGVLNIGRNLLKLDADAAIEEASPFSTANMIETNISFTDNGLKKVFRAGGSQVFIFPMGSNSKYTPVRLDISANSNNTGSITVKPASEMHPGVVEDTESGAQIVDKDNALQYYWTLKAEGISGFSANARMYYSDTDVKVTAPYTVADYHTASLLTNGDGTWLKFSKASFDETSKYLSFDFTGKSDNEISGDYTAGSGDATLDGAIPAHITSYETNSSGNWSTGTIWTPNVGGGPRGGKARINQTHYVDVTANSLSVYMTEVNGNLDLHSTFGHRLGIVNGTGTILLERGEMPAGVYDNFFSSAGGTLHFGGLTGYEILGNIPEVNHLELSGSGEKRFSNNNLTINGNLTIAGAADLNVINYYNCKISIKGNLTRATGSFEAGTGANATFAFTGTLPQTITGSFSNSQAFNNLEINNINDIIISGDVEIDRELRLTNGLMNVSSGNLLRINYGAFVSPQAGTSLSFVNGPVVKELMNGNSFTFPTGNYTGTKAHGPITLQAVTGPAGINDWKASYFYASPTIAGFNTALFESPVSTVSNTEYWKVEAPTGGASIMTILLDGSSDVASALDDLTDLRIVGWNATDSRWEVVGMSATITGTKTSGTISTTSPVNYGSFSYFTLASVTPVATGTATITSPSLVNLCNGSSTNITVNFTGEMPYVLTYTAGGTPVTTPAINTYYYNITVNPSVTTTYTLTNVTANGATGTISGTTSVTVNVNPVPTVNLSRSGSGSICEGTSITFTATPGLSNYNFRVNGITVQNSAVNTFVTTSLPVGTQSIDVIGTNAGGCSATSSAIPVTVNPFPGPAGTVSGEASVCRNSTRTYTVPLIPDATSYSWSVTGAGATGTSTTNSINLTFPTAGTAIITVRGVNSCGNGAPSTLNVAVNTASTPGNAGSITGISQVCQGGTGYSYTVSPVANATSYIWTYSGTGATIIGTGNSVTVDFAAGATSGNLRVAGTNGCATGGLSPNFSITVNQPPTASISPADPSSCSNSPIIITATPAGGTSPYTIHAWTGTGSAYLSSLSVPDPTFNSPAGGSFGLTYTVTDTRGCVGSASTTVTIYQAPVANAGPDATGLCTGTSPIAMTGSAASGSYSGTPIWSGSGGTWTQNPDPALATFTPSTPSGSTIATLTLTGANGCSNATDSRVISWNRIPPQPGAFTVSSATVCQGQTGVTYIVPNDPLATSYNWSYTIGSGAVITGTGNSVTVDFSIAATSGILNVTAANSCGTSPARTIAVTVNIPPVASFSYPGSPYCPTATDPLPVFNGGGIAGIFSSSPGLVFINVSTGEIDLSASVPGAYTVTNTIAATGGCSAVVSSSLFEITKDYVWTGALGTSWNTAGNWSCGVVPVALNSILIPDVTNKPILSAGMEASVNNITIAPGASLTVSGNTLRIAGAIINNGIFDVSAGSVELNGNSHQSVSAGSFTGNIKNLTIDNGSGISLTGPLSITGIIYLRNGDLASDGNLTLLSTATGTALVDGSGTGNITGNVTMQRYLSSRFGYKYFSSPFQDATVNQFAEEVNLAYWFPLFYAFDENRNYMGTPIEPFYGYATPSNPLVPMTGYAVNFGADPSALTINVTGTLNNSSYSKTVTNHNHPYSLGRNLLGNPYPSPIDWNAPLGWTKLNVDNALYYFNASATDEWGGTYSSWVNGVSSDGIASNIIPSMQGFMVRASTLSPVDGTVGMDNRVRVNNMSQPFIKKSAMISEKPLLRISASFTDSYPEDDPLVIYFDEKASEVFDDQLDAVKYFNTDWFMPSFFSFGKDGSKLSINALPLPDAHIPSIPLGFRSDVDGEVIFRLRNIEGPYSWGVINLFDVETGESHDLSSGSEYKIYIPAGDYFDRFWLNFEGFATGTTGKEILSDPFLVYSSRGFVFAEINCLQGKSGILTISNITGQSVYNTKIYENGHYEFNPGAMDGIYIVSFVSGHLRFSEKIFIKAK